MRSLTLPPPPFSDYCGCAKPVSLIFLLEIRGTLDKTVQGDGTGRDEISTTREVSYIIQEV